MTQTTYNAKMKAGVAGMIANMRAFDVITGICASAAIGFGLAVSRSTGRKDYIIGGSLGAFMGATVNDKTLVHNTVDQYQLHDNMAIMTNGVMWVQPAVAITRGDNVNFSTTTGQFSNTGGAGPILGAEWLESSGLGDLNLLYLPAYKS